MSAPPRLTDDPSSPDSLRRDLRTTARTPSRRYDAQRGLESLSATLAGLPLASVPPPPSSHGLGPTFWGVTGVGTGVVIGAILAGGYLLSGDAPHRPVPRVEAPRTEIAQAEPADDALPIAPAPIAAPARAESPPPMLQRHAAPDPDAMMRAEIAQLAQIRAAHDPARTLRLAQEGQRRFPRGMFREEREALLVISLARLGRPEARERGAAFLTRYPRGTFSEEIEHIVHAP